jgi:hypothetical protein
MRSIVILSTVIVNTAMASTIFNLQVNSTDDMHLRYCQSNQYYCTTSCAMEPQINLCNKTTLKWDCVCSQFKRLPVAYQSFPIEVAQCTGELQACVTDCTVTATGVESTKCTANCNARQRCGSVNANQQLAFYYYSDRKPEQSDSSIVSSFPALSLMFLLISVYQLHNLNI